MHEEAGLRGGDEVVEDNAPASGERLEAVAGPEFERVHKTVEEESGGKRAEAQRDEPHRDGKGDNFVDDDRARVLFSEVAFPCGGNRDGGEAERDRERHVGPRGQGLHRPAEDHAGERSPTPRPDGQVAHAETGGEEVDQGAGALLGNGLVVGHWVGKRAEGERNRS